MTFLNEVEEIVDKIKPSFPSSTNYGASSCYAVKSYLKFPYPSMGF